MAHSRKGAITIEEAREEKGTYTATPLSALPTALLRYSILGFSGLGANAQLAQTNSRFKNLPEAKEATVKFGKNLEQLLLFVAEGKKKEAEELILQCPELLLTEGKTKDYSSRKLQGTALQIALGAEDINLYDQTGKKLLGKGMVEMIQHHLRKLPDGEAIIAEQIQKQFPDGWKDLEEKEHEYHLSALREVRDAIKASSNNQECQEAIQKFKDALAPKKIITTGKHWDAKLLLAAFEMSCEEHFWKARKDNLFHKAVVGYLQTLAPANYAMAQAQGLIPLLVNGENFKRDLVFNYRGRPCDYYPLSDCSNYQLGSDFWLDCGGGLAYTEVWHALTHQSSFKALLEQKQQYYDNLCRSQTFTRAPTFGAV